MYYIILYICVYIYCTYINIYIYITYTLHIYIMYIIYYSKIHIYIFTYIYIYICACVLRVFLESWYETKGWLQQQFLHTHLDFPACLVLCDCHSSCHLHCRHCRFGHRQRWNNILVKTEEAASTRQDKRKIPMLLPPPLPPPPLRPPCNVCLVMVMQSQGAKPENHSYVIPPASPGVNGYGSNMGNHRFQYQTSLNPQFWNKFGQYNLDHPSSVEQFQPAHRNPVIAWLYTGFGFSGRLRWRGTHLLLQHSQRHGAWISMKTPERWRKHESLILSPTFSN